MIEPRLLERELQVTVDDDGPPLDSGLEERIEALWDAAQADCGGTMFNGSILTVFEEREDTLKGRFVPYSHVVAQRRDPDLFEVLGLRPLAVSGILAVDEGYVFGLRGADVVIDRGLWELAPSGAVDAGCLSPDGTADIFGQLRREAEEELNVPGASLRGLNAFVLLHNTATHVTEIGIAGRIACNESALRRAFEGRTNREYDSLRIVPEGEADDFVHCTPGTGIDPTSRALVAARRAVLEGASR